MSNAFAYCCLWFSLVCCSLYLVVYVILMLVASIFFITGFYWFLLGWGFYWVVDNLWLSRSWKIELLKLQNNDTIFLFLDHSHQVLRDCFCFFFLDAFTSWVSGVLDPEGSASGDVVTSVKR